MDYQREEKVSGNKDEFLEHVPNIEDTTEFRDELNKKDLRNIQK